MYDILKYERELTTFNYNLLLLTRTMHMAFLETKHTLSRVNKIKRDLIKVVSAVSYISMAAFMAYYIYLVICNLTNYLYLSIYSCLILIILSSFIIELCVRKERKFLKNERRLVSEKKRRIKTVVKIIKFLAKSVLVGIAIYETVTNFDMSLSNIANIGSAVMLVVQVLLEIVINYIVKQIDYFRLSIELDLDESGTIIKRIMNIVNPMKSMEETVIKANQGMLYSEQEQKMIDDIRKEAEIYVNEKEERAHTLKDMYGALDKKEKKTFISKIFKKKNK